MRSALVAAVLSVVAASPGVAANISPAAKAATSAPYDWSGVYVGGHIGGGWQSTQFTPTFNQHISEVKIGLSYKFMPGFLFW